MSPCTEARDHWHNVRSGEPADQAGVHHLLQRAGGLGPLPLRALVKTESPDPWGAWSKALLVQTERLPRAEVPPGASGAHRVLVDGTQVGFVVSQREGRGYYWGSVVSLGERAVYGVQDKRTALSNLLGSAGYR